MTVAAAEELITQLAVPALAASIERHRPGGAAATCGGPRRALERMLPGLGRHLRERTTLHAQAGRR